MRQRICELGLWTVCRLFDSRRRDIAYVRRYRSRRAGRRRPVPAITPVGNGAYMVKCQRLLRRTISCALPCTLTYLCDCSSADVREASASGSHLVIVLFNIRLFGNKIDDLLEVRRDRSIDVLCLISSMVAI